MQNSCKLSLLCCVGLATVVVTPASAQNDAHEKITSAISAAPSSITDDATIMDWPAEPGGEMMTLREGSNGWTCFPDNPGNQGNDPMCLDATWMSWADAWMNRTEPDVKAIGFSYMLAGDAAVSNTDPFAEGPTPDNEWISDGEPHIMILVPNDEILSGLPTDPANGGPWVMWRDTPYVHIMAPMPDHRPGMHDDM